MKDTIELRNILARGKKELQAYGCDLVMFPIDYQVEKSPFGRVRYPFNYKTSRGIIISKTIIKEIEFDGDTIHVLLSGLNQHKLDAYSIRFSVNVFNKKDPIYVNNVNHIADIIRRLNNYFEPSRRRFVDKEVKKLTNSDLDRVSTLKIANSLLLDLANRSRLNLFKLTAVFNRIVFKSVNRDVLLAGKSKECEVFTTRITPTRLFFKKRNLKLGSIKTNRIMLTHIDELRLYRSDGNYSINDQIKIKWLNHLITSLRKEK